MKIDFAIPRSIPFGGLLQGSIFRETDPESSQYRNTNHGPCYTKSIIKNKIKWGNKFLRVFLFHPGKLVPPDKQKKILQSDFQFQVLSKLHSTQ